MTTPKLDLPEIAESQASKYLTHNQALRDLDAITQPHIISQQPDIPVSTFAEGDTYIITSAVASGNWNGQKNNIAYYFNSAWIIVSAVTDGWRVYDNNLGVELIYANSSWGTHITDGISSATITDKGQLLVGTGNALVSVLPIGSPGQVLKVDAAGSTVEWAAVAGTGDVTGPASATANGIPRFSGSTGKAIITSNWAIVSVTDIMTAGGTLDMNNEVIKQAEIQDYSETVVSVNVSAGVTDVSLDMTTANVFHVVLQANASVGFTNPPASLKNGSLTVYLDQDGTGSRTLTLKDTIIYASGAASTISSGASEKDIWTFTTRDGGTTWYAMAAGRKFA